MSSTIQRSVLAALFTAWMALLPANQAQAQMGGFSGRQNGPMGSSRGGLAQQQRAAQQLGLLTPMPMQSQQSQTTGTTGQMRRCQGGQNSQSSQQPGSTQQTGQQLTPAQLQTLIQQLQTLQNNQTTQNSSQTTGLSSRAEIRTLHHQHLGLGRLMRASRQTGLLTTVQLQPLAQQLQDLQTTLQTLLLQQNGQLTSTQQQALAQQFQTLMTSWQQLVAQSN